MPRVHSSPSVLFQIISNSKYNITSYILIKYIRRKFEILSIISQLEEMYIYISIYMIL